jgi:hypothetical protein
MIRSVCDRRTAALFVDTVVPDFGDIARRPKRQLEAIHARAASKISVFRRQTDWRSYGAVVERSIRSGSTISGESSSGGWMAMPMTWRLSTITN